MSKILILGGYGNFGKRIARALVKKNLPVIIAGRSKDKAEHFVATLPASLTTTAIFDVNRELAAQLDVLKPSVVINTCGPFQTSDYQVAQTCIAKRVHYIDLADGRDFVAQITTLDQAAREQGVTVISGASTVPGLSSAVIEHYLPEFSIIDSLTFGISPGQQAERGLATTQAILGYAGKPLKKCAGAEQMRYGWQDSYRQIYPEFGPRWMANCDIPDLDLLPARYGIRAIRFSAGMELGMLHHGLWLLSWLVRLGLPLELSRYARPLLKISDWFNRFGSANGGMHVLLRGLDQTGSFIERRWFILAKNGDGPQIPCVPAIVLAEQLSLGVSMKTGAFPCLGLVSLETYLKELMDFHIVQATSRHSP